MNELKDPLLGHGSIVHMSDAAAVPDGKERFRHPARVDGVADEALEDAGP